MCHMPKKGERLNRVKMKTKVKAYIHSKEIKTSFPVHLLLCCDTYIINELLIILNEKK